MAKKLVGGPQKVEYKKVNKENFAVKVIGYFGNSIDEKTQTKNVFLVGERLDTNEKIVLKQIFQSNYAFYENANEKQKDFAKSNFPSTFAAKEHENEMELAKRAFEEGYAKFERNKDNKLVFTKNGNIKVEKEKLDEKGFLKNNQIFQGNGTDAFKFKQKSLVEPGGIIIIKGGYQDTKLKTSDLLKNEKDEKFKAIYKKICKPEILIDEGEEAFVLKTQSSKEPILSQEQIEALPLYNYNAIERVMNFSPENLNQAYMFNKHMHLENGLIQITPIIETENPNTKIKSKHCLVKFLDINNSMSFASWKEFEEKIKESVDILSQKGNLAGSFVMVRMLTEDGKIDVPEPLPKGLSAEEMDDGTGKKQYVLPNSAEYTKQLIEHFKDIFQKKYEFTKEDFSNPTLFKDNYAVRAEIIPGKNIYFSKKFEGQKDFGNNIESFISLQELIKNSNNYEEVVNKVKKTPLEHWLKKNLFMENFEIPQMPDEPLRNGYIEGCVSFSQNPNNAFGAYLGSIVSKYEPGSLSCAADRAYKKSADPRFVCASEYAFKTKNIEPNHPDIENQISKGRIFKIEAPINPATLQETQQVEKVVQTEAKLKDEVDDNYMEEATNQSLDYMHSNDDEKEMASVVDDLADLEAEVGVSSTFSPSP